MVVAELFPDIGQGGIGGREEITGAEFVQEAGALEYFQYLFLNAGENNLNPRRL